MVAAGLCTARRGDASGVRPNGPEFAGVRFVIDERKGA
jgi:hypothetical protein